MSELSFSEASNDGEKPVRDDFPPFDEPKDDDFDEDISQDEREFYISKFTDLSTVSDARLHCTACDRHLGNTNRNESRMRTHPMLRTLMCHSCHTFYNSGEFDKGEDGSELYCRWCGQGGQVYCCSDCPHVFCAKCIKRNLGMQKIKEIESMDDWKCFKCNPKCLWDLRAICWALLRFCDLRNKMLFKMPDSPMKEKFQKAILQDTTQCCKDKRRRNVDAKRKTEAEPRRKSDIKREKKEEPPKRDKDDLKKATTALISKMPPTIQVKKFASINLDDRPDTKKAQKRSASPKIHSKSVTMKNPIAIAPLMRPVNVYPSPVVPVKKLKFTHRQPGQFDRVRFAPRVMRQPHNPYMNMITNIPSFNGYNNMAMANPVSDNINLSLESLTQGLDMATVASMGNTSMAGNIMGGHGRNNDDVVCTPDFPIEPLCEVFEDNDDDVQCITPVPSVPPVARSILPKQANKVPDLSPDNIIQMTENDVTVNAQTGGLKFRVDPQTLSSNKMYRLPDGRVFAINSNPSMPGGYSATIVAVTENKNTPVMNPRGQTYSAKVCAVPASSKPPPLSKIPPRKERQAKKQQAKTNANISNSKLEDILKNCDTDVPVEWYRYNVIDAYDALEYALGRLRKLKEQATTVYLRSRSVPEMRTLTKTLDRLLHNSAARFSEVRDNLNQGMKQYSEKKNNVTISNSDDDDDDDDDVEILSNENEGPIFIDENSMDSNNATRNESQDVDLLSSDINDSGEKESDRLPPGANGSTSNKKDDDVVCDEVVTTDTVQNDKETFDNANDELDSELTGANDTNMSVDDESVPGEQVNGELDKTSNKEDVTEKDEEDSNNVESEIIGEKGDGDQDNSDSNNVESEIIGEKGDGEQDNSENIVVENNSKENSVMETENVEENDDKSEEQTDKNENKESESVTKEDSDAKDLDGDDDKMQKDEECKEPNDDVEKILLTDIIEAQDSKSQDPEITDELIDNLLNDDPSLDVSNVNILGV